MKKVVLLFIIYTFLQVESSTAQSVDWWAPTSLSNGTKKVCNDGFGNIYLFTKYGWYGNYTDTITKIDTLGNVLAQMTLPGRRLVNMVLAPDKGYYAGGVYSGSLTVGNNSYLSNGGIDIWFARYNSAGALTWFKTFGSKADDYLGDLCINGSGLVMTGSLGDTTYINGQVFTKANHKDLFVATFNSGGAVLACKLGWSTTTQSNSGYSVGRECEADAGGNVYLLAEAYGENYFDTLTISSGGGAYSTILKTDGSLNPLFKYAYSPCYYACSSYDNLLVSTSGESYVASHYSYGQSGNDIQSAQIHYLNNSGLSAGTFALRPDMKTDISDMKLDACDNLNFTGFWYSHWGDTSFYGSCVLGQLNSQLQVNWMWNDSIQTASPRGTGLCLLGQNKYFINGYSVDTIVNSQGIFPGGNTQGFFTRIKGPLNSGCLAVGLTEYTNASESLSIFPNPGSDKFTLPNEAVGSDIKVYNAQGSLLLHQKQTGNELNLDNFSEGVYVIHLKNASGENKYKQVILVK